MGKKSVTSNPHVVICPEDDYDQTIFIGRQPTRAEYMNRRAEKLLSEVKRHIDNVASVSVEHDVEHVCSFCGAEWTEPGTKHNGGCCAEDEANNPAALPHATAAE